MLNNQIDNMDANKGLWIVNAILKSKPESKSIDDKQGDYSYWTYAIVKSSTIEECYNTFISGCRELNEYIRYIDSIWNVQNYLEERLEDHDSIDKNILANANYLKQSENNFVIIKNDFCAIL